MDDFEHLRIARIECGNGTWHSAGLADRKCIPFAILVQPLRGWYVVSAGGRRLRIQTGDAVLIATDEPVTFAHHDDRDGLFSARWLHVQALVGDVLDPCALHITPHHIPAARCARIGALLQELQGHAGPAQVDRLARLGLAALALSAALEDAPEHPRARERMASALRCGLWPSGCARTSTATWGSRRSPTRRGYHVRACMTGLGSTSGFRPCSGSRSCA